jgi:hypothetical protein
MSDHTTPSVSALTIYDTIWFVEVCLNNIGRLDSYLREADRIGDTELAAFFRRAKLASRVGAIDGKTLLAARFDGPDRLQ